MSGTQSNQHEGATVIRVLYQNVSGGGERAREGREENAAFSFAAGAVTAARLSPGASSHRGPCPGEENAGGLGGHLPTPFFISSGFLIGSGSAGAQNTAPPPIWGMSLGAPGRQGGNPP